MSPNPADGPPFVAPPTCEARTPEVTRGGGPELVG
jgi:hypothetical protein